jgi:hypothetical protein
VCATLGERLRMMSFDDDAAKDSPEMVFSRLAG